MFSLYRLDKQTQSFAINWPYKFAINCINLIQLFDIAYAYTIYNPVFNICQVQVHGVWGNLFECSLEGHLLMVEPTRLCLRFAWPLVKAGRRLSHFHNYWWLDCCCFSLSDEGSEFSLMAF